MTILNVHNLWVDYNAGPVFKNVCLRVEPGMVIGLLVPKASKLAMWRRPSKTDFAGAEKGLDDIGAGGLTHRVFNDLSGGEKQMVLLVRAMFQCSDVLLLDEPTSHLPPGPEIRD